MDKLDRQFEERIGRATAMEYESATIARALWQATSEADAQTVRSMLAPDITWRTQSKIEVEGELQGPDAILDHLARAGERVDSLTSSLLNIFSNDDGAVLHYRIRVRRGLVNMDNEVLLVLTIHDGVVSDALAVPVDAQKDAAFWGRQ